MNQQVKIPTLLGLGVLFTGLLLGVILVLQKQTFLTKAIATGEPKDIKIVNISESGASVTWKTDIETTGFVTLTTSQNSSSSFLDTRDHLSPAPHKLHLINLNHLTAGTTYSFKIISGGQTFPKATTLTFKTSAELSSSLQKPIIGTILDATLKPVTEALVFLKAPKAQPIATITKVTGNFILPLANLKSEDLISTYDMQQAQDISLQIVTPDQVFNVIIKTPLGDAPLPQIILGQTGVITLKTASVSAQPTPVSSPNYDLNHDGKFNALDSAVIVDIINQGSKADKQSALYKQADLNGDGLVDNKDLQLMNNYLAKNF